MSNLIFPALVGLTWERTRTPEFKTLLQESVSGLQSAVQLQLYPRYGYKLSYDALRSDIAHLEYQALLGFFNQVGGVADNWLFSDWEDNQVTGQPIGTGDGSTTSFQLVRTLGGFTEPVLMQNQVSNVYLNGAALPQGGEVTIGGLEATIGGEEVTIGITSPGGNYWTVQNGVITFANAPAAGVAITADFSFYWRCRFTEDTIDADTLWYQFWVMKKVEFKTVKLGSG